jgi:hypothetical protein
LIFNIDTKTIQCGEGSFFIKWCGTIEGESPYLAQYKKIDSISVIDLNAKN